MKTLTLTDSQFCALERIIGNITQYDIEKFLTPYGYKKESIKETQEELYPIWDLIKEARQ